VRGSLAAARDVGRRLLGMAEATGDRAILLAAHNTLGIASFYGGEFEASLPDLERGIELYDPSAHSPTRSSALDLIVDSGLSCIVHAAWSLWALGYPERAAMRLQEALALTRAIDHPFSLAHGFRSAAAFHHCLRARDAIREHAQISVDVSTEHGFGAVLMAANFHLGWLLADEGREEDGLASMRAWVSRCREIRAECLVPNYLGWLAEAHGRLGRPHEGLELIGEALAAVSESGNHYLTAELHRLRGTLAAKESDSESSLLEAIEIARRQKAKSFELRAAADLSRLWARQGRTREAHALLAEVHAWFTEGFDTPDLADARALLEELERPGTARRRNRRDARRGSERSPRGGP
jgi:predicted ATPase